MNIDSIIQEAERIAKLNGFSSIEELYDSLLNNNHTSK